MREPDPERARAYLGSGSESALIMGLVRSRPWLFKTKSVDYKHWAQGILSANGFAPSAALILVGSAATGFSLSPEKPGASFRTVGDSGKASDLDFALVDSRFFTDVWDALVAQEAKYRDQRTEDSTRIRVYWGRIQDDVVPHELRPKVRALIASIQREQICTGHTASIRLYRRLEDMMGYSLWCLRQLKKAVM